VDNKFIAITRKYEETFAETMKELSKEKEENIIAIGIVTLCADGYYTYFGNCGTMDKHTMASVMQTEAIKDDMDADISEAVCGVLKQQAGSAILEGVKAVLDVMGIDYDNDDLKEAGEKLNRECEAIELGEDGYPESAE